MLHTLSFYIDDRRQRKEISENAKNVVSSVNIIILKIFSPNELAKKFAVLTQNCLLILSKNGFPEIARF
jgi:hypothetical protein